jgi:hypothetical protein
MMIAGAVLRKTQTNSANSTKRGPPLAKVARSK